MSHSQFVCAACCIRSSFAIFVTLLLLLLTLCSASSTAFSAVVSATFPSCLPTLRATTAHAIQPLPWIVQAVAPQGTCIEVVTCGSYRRGKASSGDIDILITDSTGWPPAQTTPGSAAAGADTDGRNAAAAAGGAAHARAAADADDSVTATAGVSDEASEESVKADNGHRGVGRSDDCTIMAAVLERLRSIGFLKHDLSLPDAHVPGESDSYVRGVVLSSLLRRRSGIAASHA